MNIETVEALRIDERGEIGWAQLIELSGLSDAELTELVDDGALVPVDPAAPSWSFTAYSAVVARTAGRLHRDFDLDAHGLAVVLRFVAKIEELERQLRALRAGAAGG
jgi:hypothetical protein